MSDLGVVYDRARLTGELDYRRPFGGTGGTGSRVTIPFTLVAEFENSEDPLLLALYARIKKQADEEAVRYYSNHLSALGDF